jgi:hypothetical protein
VRQTDQCMRYIHYMLIIFHKTILAYSILLHSTLVGPSHSGKGKAVPVLN